VRYAQSRIALLTLIAEGFKDTRARYATALRELASQRLDLPNTDLDTGQPAARGEDQLADRTYFDLLERLARRRFAHLPAALGSNIAAYYSTSAPPPTSRKERKRAEKVDEWLTAMTTRQPGKVTTPH
jgi:hypothetical protein